MVVLISRRWPNDPQGLFTRQQSPENDNCALSLHLLVYENDEVSTMKLQCMLLCALLLLFFLHTLQLDRGRQFKMLVNFWMLWLSEATYLHCYFSKYKLVKSENYLPNGLEFSQSVFRPGCDVIVLCESLFRPPAKKWDYPLLSFQWRMVPEDRIWIVV